MSVRGVIYDCDGVLFESRQANLAYYNEVLKSFGEPPVTEEQPEKAHLCHTAASPRVFAELLGEKRLEEALEIAGKLHYRQFMPYMRPEPEMEATLRSLSSRMPLAVATNRGTSMPEILEHFGLSDYFSAVVTSRDVPQPKPAPDMLLLAAERLGLEVGELLFVGDSVLDQMAAQAAGMRFVAYGGELDVELSIDSHAQLDRILAGFNGGGRGKIVRTGP